MAETGKASQPGGGYEDGYFCGGAFCDGTAQFAIYGTGATAGDVINWVAAKKIRVTAAAAKSGKTVETYIYLKNDTDAVTIYTLTCPAESHAGAAATPGTPLASYDLPANKDLKVTKSYIGTSLDGWVAGYIED